MSRNPNMAEESWGVSQTLRDGSGFLFCFKKHSACTTQTESISNMMIGTMVDVLTWSDMIHVEVVPVERYIPETQEITASEYSYTAFMTTGFVRQDSDLCCNSRLFTYLYLPLDKHTTHRGTLFLESLVGTRYNKAGMWSAFWHQFIGSKTIELPMHFNRKPVFCSEAGLMVCYIVGAYTGPELPQHCTPKYLYNILVDCHAKYIPSLMVACPDFDQDVVTNAA